MPLCFDSAIWISSCFFNLDNEHKTHVTDQRESNLDTGSVCVFFYRGTWPLDPWLCLNIGCPKKHEDAPKTGWCNVKPQFLDYESSILTNMNTVINPLIGRCKLTVYLVGGFNLPSWKIWIRQWEGWHPIYVMENNNNVPNHQPGLVGFPKLPFLRRTFDFFSTDASIHWALPSWQHKSSASHKLFHYCRRTNLPTDSLTHDKCQSY